MLDGGCVQGVLGRAGFLGIPRSTNLRTAATPLFSSSEVAALKWEIPSMFKVTPNPPNEPDLKLNQAAHRAIDHYLNPETAPPSSPPGLFSVAADASSETLITNSYETFSSVTALLLDLSEDLTGKQRDVALAIHQLSELGVLLMDRLMEREAAVAGG